MGYNQLSDAVSRDTPVIEPAKSQAGDNSKPVSLEMPMYESREWPVTTKRRISLGWIIGGVAALLVLGAGGYFLFGRGSSYDRDMADAVAMMQSGRPESARGVFTRVAMEHPDQAEPHVFLSRIARNEGDLNTARRELETAIRNEPANPLPLREMGLLLLATDQAELARRFLVRAVQAAPADMAAQGYLGCALVRLNRVDEGQRFLMRAGPGAWSSCAQPVNRPAGS